MERRTGKRVSLTQEIFISSKNEKRSATLTNCSEEGMYIKTSISYPFDYAYEVFIPEKNSLLKVPVKVIRIDKSGPAYDGMGVELLDLPQKYLEFVIKHYLHGESQNSHA
jgi:hypothetical protein